MTPCPRCGCTGLHACIGHKPTPMTEAEKAKLSVALEKIKEKRK